MKIGMECFLSEEAIELHKEYLRTLKFRYSVMEKSFPEIKDANLDAISRMRHMYKDEILALKSEIFCHELFFNSFGELYQSSSLVKENYRTESTFLYGIFDMCKSSCAAFLIINKNKGCVNTALLKEPKEILKIPSPVLSLDLCEHSYFLDYGFDRERYLTNLLPYINLSILDIF